ncbi:hypothetical protein AM493_20160 [Flavobacterium akiainvivens]|uniref:Uncharacterized protein n=1 Tax=Flavobacterium akiainvivens TaxID=1202724 RepID=A0A0M8MC51_9FLAO|nr:hypothetical protein [Flavobacterium akiainvivens]KOS08103.1 hypothetical protein AM493_20160 [Flavobacterium akiainvivens]SFQ71888.1 hypothetical protein SAMN05444144_11740 [Flavobacterium akiainvivens]
MLLQIITYILIGLAAITNLWVGYERQFLYVSYVFPDAKWPGFTRINKALANAEHSQWHPRLKRLKKLLLAAYILPVGIVALIVWQIVAAQ